MSSHPASEPAAEGAAKIRIAIVFGGRSSEHAVSCATAAGVMSAIDRERYDIIPIGIAPTGEWVLVDPSVDLSLSSSHTPAVPGDGPEVLLPMKVGDHALRVIDSGDVPATLSDVDVIFPVLHGPFGEDGTVQGFFDLSDLRYVGSGVLASAAGMDKHYMKLIFAGEGLPVGPYAVITDRAWRADPVAAMEAATERLSYPVFVKPARAGSSMGISRVTTPGGLREAIEAAREHDPKVIIEEGIVGREVECAVLQGHGTQAPRTSAVAEINVHDGHDFYDFEAKYLAESDVDLICPADLAPSTAARVQELAAAAFEALGCEGLARVDCFVREDGEVIVNEINTMPGFTPHSMYPRMWTASGISYPELIDELVSLALERRLGLR